TNRTAEPVTKTADIDPKQAAKNDSDRCLVRYNQHVALIKFLLDFINYSQTAAGYRNCLLAPSGRVPGRVCQPTDVIVVILLVDFLLFRSFPFAITDFVQISTDLHPQSQF